MDSLDLIVSSLKYRSIYYTKEGIYDPERGAYLGEDVCYKYVIPSGYGVCMN
jgi:hypothetical protein